MKQLSLFLASALLGIASAGGARADGDSVVLGSDYFATAPGTFFDFGSPWGVVDFKGYPFGPGSTDTIVQRSQDVLIGGAAGPLQLTALSMESVDPVPVPAVGLVNVFVTLNPDRLAEDVGQITINGNLSGGTFSSFFDVFFDVCLSPGADGVGCAVGTPVLYQNPTALELQNSGADWSSTPYPSSVIVSGPVGDINANEHTGLSADQSDFWPAVIIEAHPDGLGQHVVVPATTPEASTWIMLLLGFAALCAAPTARSVRSIRAVA